MIDFAPPAILLEW